VDQSAPPGTDPQRKLARWNFRRRLLSPDLPRPPLFRPGIVGQRLQQGAL